MGGCTDLVGSAKFVSNFDLLMGYWQVPLTARAQKISAFMTPFGLYEYTIVSFGFRNAPATFQHLMNLVIAGLDGCAVYLNDVVFSDTWDDLCQFARVTVMYLGWVVGQGQFCPVDTKGSGSHAVSCAHH